jgi:hypothetical protein
MLVIPFSLTRGRYSVFVVLGDDNWSRITEYDPVVIPFHALGSEWANLQLQDVVITYANAADHLEIERLAAANDMPAILRHLARGFSFHPERGDHDRGPQTLL